MVQEGGTGMTGYKGKCSVCPGSFAVRVDDTLRVHLKPGPMTRRKRPNCPGSRKHPIFTWRVRDAKD